MRLSLVEDRITLAPGRPGTAEIEVTNTLDAIDGLTARIVGLDGVVATCEPLLLPLFPNTTGRILLKLTVPPSFPAGPHRGSIEVDSSVAPDQPGRVTLGIEVVPHRAAEVTVIPPLRSGTHRASYEVVLENTGNTALDMGLAASDPERAVATAFTPQSTEVQPGKSAKLALAIKTRRRLLGGDTTRALTVLATTTDLEVEAGARFRQRPVIPRGLRTVIVLAVILALWAMAFLFGLSRAFGHDTLTKQAPPSFYASCTTCANAASSFQPAALDLGVPTWAVPKSGVDDSIGGQVSGKVVAASTGSGIGRITIEAVRDTPNGTALVASAATDTDGSYTLDGLLPGSYKLHFTAEGFQDLWYPTPVTVDAMQPRAVDDVTIAGMPGKITGDVDTGQEPPVPVTVTVQPLEGATATPIPPVVTSQGHYVVTGLPAPGSYDLSFSAFGYKTASDVETLGGGEDRVAATIRLSAGSGEIDGVVTDGTNPLGGVTITATSNGQTITSATPTTGSIGHFSLAGLVTPGTYLLTFAKDAFGTKTIAVALGPGQVNNNLTVAMVGGAGGISGQVVDQLGHPIGGVTVTVNGGAAPISTQTLTAGAVGTYVISGLATPGHYTVTFSIPGFAGQTVPADLSSSGVANNVNGTLALTAGEISGTVMSNAAGNPALAGVTVTSTDGTTVRTTMSSSSPPGAFAITGLPPGTYSVTFSVNGFANQTVLVQLAPGQHAVQNIVLAAAG
jgi:hypothetical protein